MTRNIQVGDVFVKTRESEDGVVFTKKYSVVAVRGSMIKVRNLDNNEEMTRKLSFSKLLGAYKIKTESYSFDSAYLQNQ